MDKPEIFMYTMPTCGYCAKMKKELDEAGVSYTEKDYKEHKKDWDHVKSLTRSAVFPTFEIGKEYLVPSRDFLSPKEAIQSLQYYQNVVHRDQTIEDVIELIKNNMYMTKMLMDKVDSITKRFDEEDRKNKHQEDLQKRRMEVVERNKKMAKEIEEKRREHNINPGNINM